MAGGPRVGLHAGKVPTSIIGWLQEGQAGCGDGAGGGGAPNCMGEPVCMRMRSRLRSAAG